MSLSSSKAADLHSTAATSCQQLQTATDLSGPGKISLLYLPNEIVLKIFHYAYDLIEEQRGPIRQMWDQRQVSRQFRCCIEEVLCQRYVRTRGLMPYFPILLAEELDMIFYFGHWHDEAIRLASLRALSLDLRTEREQLLEIQNELKWPPAQNASLIRWLIGHSCGTPSWLFETPHLLEITATQIEVELLSVIVLPDSGHIILGAVEVLVKTLDLEDGAFAQCEDAKG